MIRTGLGKKSLQLDSPDIDKAYKLMETPKVPADVWGALQESERASESTSGADQTLKYKVPHQVHEPLWDVLRVVLVF